MTATLPDRLLADDELLNRLFAESNNFGLHEDVRALLAEAHNAIVEAAAALSGRVPEGDMARALEWVRDVAGACSDEERAALDCIEEAIAAYDPNAGGNTALSGREAVAWLCVSPDGVQVDATASENTRADYARFGRTITPLYTAPQPGDGWRPIMTAPHGVMILLADMGAMEARHWSFVGWRHAANAPQCATTAEKQNRTATHWMPLPAAPSAKGVE